MEAYRTDRFGSVDGIVLRSSDDPRPAPKEILMRMRASSLNYRDLMALKGGGRLDPLRQPRRLVRGLVGESAVWCSVLRAPVRLAVSTGARVAQGNGPRAG
jgi:hypothetical protein